MDIFYYFYFASQGIPWKSQKSRIDLSRKQKFNHETLFPDFYNSSSQNSWFCKIWTNFAPGPGFWPFIEKTSGFGIHPSHEVKLHFGLETHQKTIQIVQAFKLA